MSTHKDDILDFDFFDEEEPPTWEEPAGLRHEPPPVRRGPRGRGPRFRAPANLTPLLRLVALIGLAILIVVLVAVWIDGRTSDRYGAYIAEIGAVGNASARLGKDLGTLLTTPGLVQEDLDVKLGGFVERAESHVRQAEELDVPGPLVPANEGAVEALRFRLNGLQGLRTSFQELNDATDATEAGQRLSQQVRRLLASDVVWADSFKAVAEQALEAEGIEGLSVPASQFVSTEELTTASSLAAIWQRIQGASTGGTPGGLHGTGLNYVKVLPSGVLLSTTTEATIEATEDLAFEVGVENTGDSLEVRIKVTLTIPAQPNPIVRTAVIPIIDPGEIKAVTMTVGDVVPFADRTTVKVDIDPVRGERNPANNTAEYPVVFSLP
ncbi:MAG TPA: hypothetical protein VNJ53_03090 [Gaiellaceae bacterium]|nr:hypothetical protein [Gaiellaceae bacterium]